MSSTKKFVFMSKQNYIILNICQNYSTKKVVAHAPRPFEPRKFNLMRGVSK